MMGGGGGFGSGMGGYMGGGLGQDFASDGQEFGQGGGMQQHVIRMRGLPFQATENEIAEVQPSIIV